MSNQDSDITQIKNTLRDIQLAQQEIISKINVVISLPGPVNVTPPNSGPCHYPKCIPGTRSTPCVTSTCDGYTIVTCSKKPLICGLSLCNNLTGTVISPDLSLEFIPPIDRISIETAKIDMHNVNGYSWQALDPTGQVLANGHSSKGICVSKFSASGPHGVRFIKFTGTDNDIIVVMCHQ